MKFLRVVLSVTLLLVAVDYLGSVVSGPASLRWSSYPCESESTKEEDYDYTLKGDDVTGSELILNTREGGNRVFYSYDIMNKSMEIEWCWKAVENVTLTGIDVIGENVFNELQHLKTVKCLDVQWIEGSAFSRSTVETVILGENKLKSIGAQAFQGCMYLREFSALGSSTLKSVGNNAFEASGLKAVTLNAGLTLGSIEQLFKDCVELENVTCSADKHIPRGCFSGCLSLQNLFGLTCRNIADTAFYSCSMLAKVTFTDPTTLGNACFEKSGITSVDLSGATKLNLTTAIYAFCDCTFLASITCSITITEFPEAFCRGCESLTEIKATTELTKISKDAFSGCSSFVPRFTYGKTVELRDNCFSGCNFTVADFSGVSISSFNYQGVFSYCVEMTSFTFPETLRLDLIPEATFRGCSKLKEVTWAGVGNTNNITKIGNYAFAGCTLLVPNFRFVEGSNSELGAGCYKGTALTEVDLSYLESLILGSSVFQDCIQLVSVSFPERIEELPSYIFAGSGLVEITIPPTITTFGYGCFEDCKSLKYVTYLGSATPGDDMFSGCKSLKAVKVNDTYESCYFGGAPSTACTWIERNKGAFAGIMIAVIVVVGAVVGLLIFLGVTGRLHCKGKD